jgi:hypothetical protein
MEMNIKVLFKKIALLTALILACSVSFAKTQFCIVNNTGTDTDIYLSVNIGSRFAEGAPISSPIGSIEYVSGMGGMEYPREKMKDV